MREGKLLALDTPSALKETALPGRAWDVFVGVAETAGEHMATSAELLKALTILEACPCVLRAGLVSDHLRAITPPEVVAQDLMDRLVGVEILGAEVAQVEPTLEDVFLALATKDRSQ
jgi:hypothetical protein